MPSFTLAKQQYQLFLTILNIAGFSKDTETARSVLALTTRERCDAPGARNSLRGGELGSKWQWNRLVEYKLVFFFLQI